MKKSIPITLITGYLGSGKTTLLNNILRNQEGYKIAVIVNDIGEVNIDAQLISKDGIVNSQDESLVPLQNGCICCSLKTDLIEQINSIIETQKFDYIIIEASGICEPLPIAQTICAMEDAYDEYGIPKLCYLDSIISVVDAKRLVEEFAYGQDLLNNQIDEEDITNLIIQQIEFCNIIILNKVAEVQEDELKQIKNVIKTLQPTAEIIETNYSQVKLSKILAQKKFVFDEVATSSGWFANLEKDTEITDEYHSHDHHHEHHENEVDEYGITTFVYYTRDPFDREKFFEYISKPWPKKIIRAKGITYFKDDKNMSYLFEQAGSLKDISEAGLWLAASPPHIQQEILDNSPDLQKDWDPFYKDRMTRIVFIGQNLPQDEIIADLNNLK